jgi:hypothetical protein
MAGSTKAPRIADLPARFQAARSKGQSRRRAQMRPRGDPLLGSAVEQNAGLFAGGRSPILGADRKLLPGTYLRIVPKAIKTMRSMLL